MDSGSRKESRWDAHRPPGEPTRRRHEQRPLGRGPRGRARSRRELFLLGLAPPRGVRRRDQAARQEAPRRDDHRRPVLQPRGLVRAPLAREGARRARDRSSRPLAPRDVERAAARADPRRARSRSRMLARSKHRDGELPPPPDASRSTSATRATARSCSATTPPTPAPSAKCSLTCEPIASSVPASSLVHRDPLGRALERRAPRRRTSRSRARRLDCRFAMSNPAVDVTLCGPKDRAELDEAHRRDRAPGR